MDLTDRTAPTPADDSPLLPDWYMPAAGGSTHLTGWRRAVVVVVILAFLLITAAGLCNTYGDLSLGS